MSTQSIWGDIATELGLDCAPEPTINDFGLTQEELAKVPQVSDRAARELAEWSPAQWARDEYLLVLGQVKGVRYLKIRSTIRRQ